MTSKGRLLLGVLDLQQILGRKCCRSTIINVRGQKVASVAPSVMETLIPWEVERSSLLLTTEHLMHCTPRPILATRPGGDRYAVVIRL